MSCLPLTSLRLSWRLFGLVPLLALHLHAADVHVVTIPSASMGTELRATLVFPNSYAASQKRFPVIYLLHGFSGNFMTFQKSAPLGDLSDRYQMILVCPDGNNSWYLNSPVNPKSAFETYIVNEVVPFVDKNYRTVARSEGRALIGSSMGGHGAITLLERHPDRFDGAGSIAGIMDITEFPHEWELEAKLGPYDANPPGWIERSAVGQIERLKGQSKGIILDCGTEDFALPGNRKMHGALLTAGIPHDYCERQGKHDMNYVNRVLEYHVLFFSKRLSKAR